MTRFDLLDPQTEGFNVPLYTKGPKTLKSPRLSHLWGKTTLFDPFEKSYLFPVSIFVFFCDFEGVWTPETGFLTPISTLLGGRKGGLNPCLGGQNANNQGFSGFLEVFLKKRPFIGKSQ